MFRSPIRTEPCEVRDATSKQTQNREDVRPPVESRWVPCLAGYPDPDVVKGRWLETPGNHRIEPIDAAFDADDHDT